MPVTLPAKYIGSLALKALSTGDSALAGQVVNTFSNSFYLRTGSDELIFVTNRSLRSPITINLDTTRNLEQLVKPMELIRVNGKELHLGTDTIIELGTASTFQDWIEPTSELGPEFTKIGKPLRLISFILSIVDTRQSVLDPHALAHPGIADFVSNGVMPLSRPGTAGRFRETALKIVGLGSGFTPSGDDTLGGFLATYNSFARTIRRAPVLLDCQLLEQKTSWISAKLLDHMQRLILDEQMQRLINAANKNENNLATALETLLPRGHTSGIDIATGAILALSLIRDVAFAKEDTEIIARALGLWCPA